MIWEGRLMVLDTLLWFKDIALCVLSTLMYTLYCM